MIRSLLILCICLFSQSSCAAKPVKYGCWKTSYNSNDYAVCKYNTDLHDIRLFHLGLDGMPLGSFKRVRSNADLQGLTLDFAMNGGMYHADRSAVGYYVEQGQQSQILMTKASTGNFGLLPNGVFHLSVDIAAVTETLAYDASNSAPQYATQSGPMLVINGKLHPKFRQGSASLKRRNGVGGMDDGKTVWFAISDRSVNFHDFGTLFKDHLETPNALFLDGVVSKLYAPDISRHDVGLAMGPIISVVSKAD